MKKVALTPHVSQSVSKTIYTGRLDKKLPTIDSENSDQISVIWTRRADI